MNGSKTPAWRRSRVFSLRWWRRGGLWLLLGLFWCVTPAAAQRRHREEKKPAAKTATAAPKKKGTTRQKTSARTERARATDPTKAGPARRQPLAAAKSRRATRTREEEPAPEQKPAGRSRARLSAADLNKTKEQLEQEKRENERRAQEANRILEQTRQRKQASLGQLNALQEKITVQQGVIGTIASEVNYLDHDVHLTEANVGSLRLDLAALKQEYARMIYAASKSANATDKLLFLFAAESFNQFVMRLRYLRQYTDVRRRQAAQIAATQQRLEEQLHGLTRKRQAKQQLLGAEVAEKQSLVSMKTEQDQVVQQLSRQEEQLKREVAERQAAIARLNAVIAEKVRAEIARAAREARLQAARRAAAKREAARRAAERPTSEATREEVAANPNTDEEDAAEAEANASEASGRITLTPEATRLSASFSSNRGRLPWPVARGFVSEHFGRHRHPVLKNVTVENLGVDIQTSEGETARAVFDGRVLTVASVPGMNTIVMIQHGDFFTVYARLRDVRVSTGQHVKVLDPIGTVFTGPDGTTELQFQIWRNSKGQNPEAWLGRR